MITNAGNVLFLNLGAGYMGVFCTLCEYSPSCMLTICALFFEKKVYLKKCFKENHFLCSITS